MTKKMRYTSLLITLTSVGTMFGCANYEVNTTRGNIPGHYIRYEMQESDRAVEAARLAGKDKICPAEFKAAEDAKNNAYDVFRACRTEEGAALAKQATAKANALCPPVVAKAEPAPVAVAPAPAIVESAPVAVSQPASKPAPVAPTDKLVISPETITSGQSATLTWTSENATRCDIQPGIGAVQTQGTMSVTPSENTTYTLVCNGEGGSAQSVAAVAVAVPVIAVAQPKAAPAKLCTQTVIDIKFDTQKSDIKAQYHDELKRLADFLTEFPAAKGTIEGHTDSDGSVASNMKLSQRRADSVRNYLINNFKIAPERITAKGFGPNKPIADNKSKAGKQKNRRIETNFSCDK